MKLDEVPWHQLQHAYGTAEDVPDLLRDLASPDKERREAALHNLYGNIFHQGTRYEATVPSIGILFELLERPEQPDGPVLVEFLTHLAVGYPEAYLPDGFDPTYLEFTSDDLEEEDEYGCGPRVVLDCYNAVLQAMPRLRALFDGRPELRASLAFLMAWFPADYHNNQSRLRSQGVEGILALGLLERRVYIEPTCQEFLEHPDLAMRTAAALACARSPLEPRVRQGLLEGLTQAQVLAEHTLIYNSGDWLGWLCLSIGRFSGSVQDLDALLEALGKVKAYGALEITQAILEMVGQGPPTGDRRRALEAILHGPGFPENVIFGNYASLLRAYGFPGDRDGLRKWLG